MPHATKCIPKKLCGIWQASWGPHPEPSWFLIITETIGLLLLFKIIHDYLIILGTWLDGCSTSSGSESITSSCISEQALCLTYLLYCRTDTPGHGHITARGQRECYSGVDWEWGHQRQRGIAVADQLGYSQWPRCRHHSTFSLTLITVSSSDWPGKHLCPESRCCPWWWDSTEPRDATSTFICSQSQQGPQGLSHNVLPMYGNGIDYYWLFIL